MNRSQPHPVTEVITGRLETSDDLLDALDKVCSKHAIDNGTLQGLGALKSANLAFYNQQTHVYEAYAFDQPMELLNLTGNISSKDGKRFLHLHVTLSDQQGRAFGGHVNPGCIVFACEFSIQKLGGKPWERKPHAETGLHLWD